MLDITLPEFRITGKFEEIKKRNIVKPYQIYTAGFSYLTTSGLYFTSEYSARSPVNRHAVNALLNESNFQPTEGFMMQLASLVFNRANRNHLHNAFKISYLKGGYKVSYVTIGSHGQEWLLEVTETKGKLFFYIRSISRHGKHDVILGGKRWLPNEGPSNKLPDKQS